MFIYHQNYLEIELFILHETFLPTISQRECCWRECCLMFIIWEDYMHTGNGMITISPSAENDYSNIDKFKLVIAIL